MVYTQSIARINTRHIARHLLLTGTSLLLSIAAANAQTPATVVGVAALVQGPVEVTSATGTKHAIASGATLLQGDTIATGSNGEMHAKLEDGGYFAVRPNSILRIDRFSAKGDELDTSTFALLRGAFRSVTGWVGKFHPQAYKISTPTATVGIRGTDHEVVYIAPQDAKPDEIAGTHDSVTHGAAFVENAKGTVEVSEGHAGFAPNEVDTAPRLHANIPNFITSRRSSNDGLVDKHYAEIDKHIEGKLREHGVLKDNESYADYVSQHAVAAKESPKPANDAERKKKPRHRAEKP